jgi:hypothetical protein
MRDSASRCAAYRVSLTFTLVLGALGCALDATPQEGSIRRSLREERAPAMEAPSEPPEDPKAEPPEEPKNEPPEDRKTATDAAGSDDDAGVAPLCAADCEGRECGSDGCQGSCGSCDFEQRCDEARGRCEAEDGEEAAAACEPDCDDRECGSDGCGGSCGSCAGGAACEAAGRCARAVPACGNGRVESGEECDGGDRCGPDCRIAETPSDFEQCQAFIATDATTGCKRCVCERCTQLATACYDSGDAGRDQACRQLAECGNRNGCYDSECYCGDALLCLAPAGLCRAETELAAGSTDVTTILACYDDPDCSTYRARSLGECLVRECSDVCGQ